jgi:hypothetical protein
MIYETLPHLDMCQVFLFVIRTSLGSEIFFANFVDKACKKTLSIKLMG